MRNIALFSLLSLTFSLSSPVEIPPISTLSLDEKIGQLIMIAAVSSKEKNLDFIADSLYQLEKEYIHDMVKNYHVGGVIFMGTGVPSEQIEETNQLQKKAKIPLLIGLDAEWGLSMRLQETIRLPRAMTLGAIQDIKEIENMGLKIGEQCYAIGVHINFAPVADVNNNPANPIINSRSFGENPDLVAQKAAAFAWGMQQKGIIACGKHFPGHGDTDVDTHNGRGTILHSRERLDQIELVPFKRLIKNGIGAIMTAHLDVPALSNGKKIPATLSYDIITKLLREELGFDGLIITDGLGMKALTNDYSAGELELKALKAGNDILLCPADVPKAIARIKKAIETGEMSEKEIDMHVERIFAAKQKVITKTITPLPQKNYFFEDKGTKEKLYSLAITLAKGERKQLNFNENNHYQVITFGPDCNYFVNELKKHLNIKHTAFSLHPTKQEIETVSVGKNEKIIVSIHLPSRSGMIEMEQESSHIIAPAFVSFINKHANQTTVALFGNPYNIARFREADLIMVGYENEPEAQEALAKALLFKKEHWSPGSLPVTS